MPNKIDKDWGTPEAPEGPGQAPSHPSSPSRPSHRGRSVSRVDTLPEDFIARISQGPLAIGDIIAGRYKLMERLGDGAMGQVFVAENLAIGRRVAVKVLKNELLADPSFRQRFQQEAEAIASIEHRNVARFLDLIVGDPTFLVMEYIRGPTLDDLLDKEKRLPPERAIHLSKRLCWALEAAHSAGIIHRDIKPSNVIVTPDLESGEEPKLIDFGLAKLATTAMKAGLTRTGQIVGTPEYMAPEQIANKAVDARADVYALGCLLYELVTGRPPFEGNDDVQVLYQQLHDIPQPAEKLAPGTPPALQAVLTRALQKKPEDRFQSMREMATALEAATRLGQGQGEAAALRGGRRKGRVGVVALVAAVVLTAAAALSAGFYLAKRGAPKGDSQLIVISTPSGAAIEVDGQPFPDPTPATVLGLQPGPHTVRLKKGNMAVVERQVPLGARERAVVNIVLPPASHPVEIHTVPEGASVWLDGKLAVGETPTVIDVTDDDFHELSVVKTGFENATRALTPDDQQASLTIALTPERQPRGTLMVDSNGASEVWIDGVDTGYTTPTLGIHVSVGVHTVEVRDGSGNRVSTKVKVAQGQTVRLLLTPGSKGTTP